MSAKTTSAVLQRENYRRDSHFRTDRFRHLMPSVKLALVRGGTIVLQFVSQILVGILAGASGLGLLQIITSWTCMLGEFLAQGLPAAAMRRVAVDYNHADSNAVENLLKNFRKRIVKAWLLSVAIIIPFIAIFHLMSPMTFSTQNLWSVTAILAVAPIFALMKLYAESLKSTGKTLLAVCFESATAPAALLFVCLVCWALKLPAAVISLTIAFALSLTISAIGMRFALSKRLCAIPKSDNAERRTSLSKSLRHPDLVYLWSSSVLSIAFLHMPFLVMPLYIETAEIGVFSIAHKLINVITTILLLLAAIYGPQFAIAAEKRDAIALSKVLARTQKISCAIFIPSTFFLILWANPLAALFGEEFGDLQLFLVILCGGQLVNAATGLSGVLLNMSGSASSELVALTLSIAIALTGTIWAGPIYGATGLAAVFSFSIAVKNIASYALAKNAMYKIGEFK